MVQQAEPSLVSALIYGSRVELCKGIAGDHLVPATKRWSQVSRAELVNHNLCPGLVQIVEEPQVRSL